MKFVRQDIEQMIRYFALHQNVHEALYIQS